MILETLVFTHCPFNQSAVDPIHGISDGRKIKVLSYLSCIYTI